MNNSEVIVVFIVVAVFLSVVFVSLVVVVGLERLAQKVVINLRGPNS